MTEKLIMHRPSPGPDYWSFKCLTCDGLVADHASIWQLLKARLIK